jgi:ABC-type glycerol-3-phosphate transport system substrate-binding protein
MTKSVRRSSAAVLLAAVAVAGCGSSAASSGQSGAQSSTQPAARGFARDPKVAACLKKQGITLPARPGGGGARPQRDPQQFQKLRTALAKCGVTPPQGRPGGGAAPPSNGTT